MNFVANLGFAVRSYLTNLGLGARLFVRLLGLFGSTMRISWATTRWPSLRCRACLSALC